MSNSSAVVPLGHAVFRQAPARRDSVARAETRSIVGLDLLRFCAALAVAAFHLGFTGWTDPTSEAFGFMAGAARFPELLPATRMGWLGVPMFFVISGFVIAFSAQGATASRFLRSRALRLMPGIWICATLTFGLALAFAPDGAPVLLERYLRTLVVFPAPRWIDGVYWTLSIEMAFYALVWALLLRRRLDRLEPVMLTIGLVSTAVWAFAATGWWPDLAGLANKRAAQLLLVTHGCEFALGVLTWRIAHAGATAGKVMGASACLLGTLFQIEATAREIQILHGVAQPTVLAGGLFLGFFIAFVLSIAANDLVLRAVPPRPLGWVRLLGLSTYPLYLMHTAVGVLSIRAARALGMTDLPSLALGVLLAVAASILVARHAEPVLRKGLAAGLARLTPRPA